MEYPQYADMVGSTMKTMFGAFLPEQGQKETFNNMIDAKVALNKGIYESSKGFIESMNKAVTAITAPQKW